MTRSDRIKSARAWLTTFSGKHIGAAYRKRYGVDWACAFKELEMLGIQIDPKYRDAVLQSVQGTIEARAKRRQERLDREDVEEADSDEYSAFIAGYTSGGAACGVTWEERDSLEENNGAENP